MANAIVDTLIFNGSIAGTSSIQAQGIAGNLIFQLPNVPPIQGQLITATQINGSTVLLGWSSAQSLTNIPLSALAQSGATTGQVIEWNGTAWVASTGVPGAGTVTSVALTAPVEFSVGGSPITSSGTLAITKANQSANTVWAGPTSGGAAAPTFRAVVAADIGANTVSIAAINSKEGNGSKVQLTNAGATVAGDVTTYDANGNVQDSGTLLSSLVPVYSTDTNRQAIRVKPSTTIGTFAPSESIPASLVVYGDGTNSNCVIQTQDQNGYFWIDAFGDIEAQQQTAGTKALLTLHQVADFPAISVVSQRGSGTANLFQVTGQLAVSPSVFVDHAGNLGVASGKTLSANSLIDVNSIAALSGSGLDITSAGTDLIQINGNSIGIVNVSSTGVAINNNTSGASVAVPTTGGVSITTSDASGITIHATGSGDVSLLSATAAVQLTPTAVSMGANNGSVAVNASGGVDVTPFTGQPTSLNGITHITGTSSFTTANPTFFSATGTGAVVLATSPTLTTPNIGAATASRLKTTNTDMAGVVSFAGASTVTYNFTSNYTGTNAPIVIITTQFDPTSANADTWVTVAGAPGAWTSFTVHNSIAQTGAVSYLVIDIG